ncbi:Ferri-bacillibactin esterase BesA [Pseudovibrio sp. Ad13]|uniref:alpha/beta hydrolase n=1 Tax=Pseudovibrio sp. Ad13 TaxID=989396 RepID=UPI0007B17D78|nr:alpha/beta hydrolase-fold protein [Pseudovibrio sp. Ad13]KZK84029.1 Ferri-bacillibactin esterase BesA [Pseudovibrio sp. Ad13]
MSSCTNNFTDLGPTPILGSNRFRIWSENVSAYFIIDVAMPNPMFFNNGPVPVMFVTDGNICFGAASTLLNSLAMEPDGPPPHCIVGIGYDVSGRGEKAEHLAIRTRDLSPCEDKRFEAMMRRAPAPFTWQDEIQAGGATSFLAFVLEELSPWLASRYDLDLTQTTLTGISMGGLFVLNTAFTQPEAFQRYMAISPAIWWADCFLIALEEQTSTKRQNVKMDIFMAVGELEEAADAHAKMVSNLVKLVDQMDSRSISGLRLNHKILKGESHMSVFSPAFSRACRALFACQNRNESWANL